MDIVCCAMIALIVGCVVGGLEVLGDKVAEEAEEYSNGRYQ